MDGQILWGKLGKLGGTVENSYKILNISTVSTEFSTIFNVEIVKKFS